jgi:hypothetical protein
MSVPSSSAVQTFRRGPLP